MYKGTTARFLVNGDLSKPIHVNAGIRQGCPLALFWFWIAVETLKHAQDQTAGLEGVELCSPDVIFAHGLLAFVYDSLVLLKYSSMVKKT